ncbi:MAG: hypothetical protein ACOYJG_11460 [Prevotella sp.]|jgi:hypothetical protein
MNDSIEAPSYYINGQWYKIESTEQRHCVEQPLSEYIESTLPIMLYDGSSFRIFVYIKINKNGCVSRIRLLNRKSFKGNMKTWKEVKRMLRQVKFRPEIKRVIISGVLSI